MILYHGTNDSNGVLGASLREGTWLALHRFHAFRIAERRAKHGGHPVVFEIDTDSFTRVEGRDNPAYLFAGGNYKIKAKHEMVRRKI